jgi:hypothetical protein
MQFIIYLLFNTFCLLSRKFQINVIQDTATFIHIIYHFLFTTEFTDLQLFTVSLHEPQYEHRFQ